MTILLQLLVASLFSLSTSVGSKSFVISKKKKAQINHSTRYIIHWSSIRIFFSGFQLKFISRICYVIPSPVSLRSINILTLCMMSVNNVSLKFNIIIHFAEYAKLSQETPISIHIIHLNASLISFLPINAFEKNSEIHGDMREQMPLCAGFFNFPQ